MPPASAQPSTPELGSPAAAFLCRPPSYGARVVTLTLCGFAVLAIAYASAAHMDVVVTAQGRIIPSGKSKVVQPLEAGTVRAIHVRDGQKVKEGQPLIELDPTTTLADRERLAVEAYEAETEVARLDAQLAMQEQFAASAGVPAAIVGNQKSILHGRLSEQRARLAALDAEIARRRAERDAVRGLLAKLRASHVLVKKKHQMREQLAREGHVPQIALIESNLEVIGLEKDLAVQTGRQAEAEAALAAATESRRQAEAEYRSRTAAELGEVTRRLSTTQHELIKATQRRELQTLRAPSDGIVQQLAVTTIGGVVTQAQILLVVVPENSLLEVEALVLNKDIGHMRSGQPAVVKVETYDYTRYGHLEGNVQWVGTDALDDKQLGPVYPVRIQLKGTETPNIIGGRRGRIAPGMSVTADIRVDERRIIEYFLAPLLRYKEESLRER